MPGNRQTMQATSEIHAGEMPCHASVANPATASARMIASTRSCAPIAPRAATGCGVIGPFSGNSLQITQINTTVFSAPSTGKCSSR